MDDAFAIQQLLNRYGLVAGQRDWDALVDTFTPDGVWSLPDVEQQHIGREAIKQALIEFAKPTVYIVQLNTPAEIQIDGDTATARCVIREFGRLVDRDEAMEVLGFYTDRLVRTEAGWRFAERRFALRAMHTVALTSIQV